MTSNRLKPLIKAEKVDLAVVLKKHDPYKVHKFVPTPVKQIVSAEMAKWVIVRKKQGFLRCDQINEALKNLSDAFAESYRKNNTSLLPRLNKVVRVHHEDGSKYEFHYAFMLHFFEWLFVFTEHQREHAFAKDDLAFYQSKPMYGTDGWRIK